MASGVGPMSFDELSEIYRMEKKSTSLTQTRSDLYRAVADYLTSLRQEHSRLAGSDPDSVMAEGVDQRRKQSEHHWKEILSTRMRKIGNMALLGAQGAHVQLGNLTNEERNYYDELVEVDRRLFTEVDRLRGKKTVDTRIDEPPVRDAKPAPMPEPAEERVPEPEEPPAPPAEIMDEAFDEEPFDEAFDEPPVPEPVPDEGRVPEPKPAPESVVEEPAPEPESDLTPILIRVLEDLPDFVGPDRDYSLGKEDLVTLPKVLADILINSEKAARVAPTP